MGKNQGESCFFWPRLRADSVSAGGWVRLEWWSIGEEESFPAELFSRVVTAAVRRAAKELSGFADPLQPHVRRILLRIGLFWYSPRQLLQLNYVEEQRDVHWFIDSVSMTDLNSTLFMTAHLINNETMTHGFVLLF
jgi:hypothetical protein